MNIDHQSFNNLHYVKIYQEYFSHNSHETFDFLLESTSNFLNNRNINNSDILSFDICNDKKFYTIKIVYRKDY